MQVKISKIPKQGETGDHVKALQNALINRGYDPGTVDGDFGPKTRQAVAKFQKAQKFPGSGKLGPKTLALLELEVVPTPVKPKPAPGSMSRQVIADKIVEKIADDVKAKLRETHGKNRSPRIDSFNKRVGAAMGAPYCASAGWCVIDDACTELGLVNPVPKTASSQDFRRKSFVPENYLRKPGELGKKGDVGTLQVVDDTTHGHHTTLSEDQLVVDGDFHTGEYNTSVAGSRDGDGAYFLVRSSHNMSPKNSGKKFVSFADIPQWIYDHNYL